MIVYLVRHGLSAANMAGLVTGTPIDCLVSEGVNQAKDLRCWLHELNIAPEQFYVSHWARARQTAELIYPDVAWIEDRRLGETVAGDVADEPLPKFLSNSPHFYESNSNEYPGGESHLDLNRRVLSFWKELETKNFSSVMLVSHSGPISCILQHVLGLDMERFPLFLQAQATLSILKSFDQLDKDGGVRFMLKGFSLGPGSNIHLSVK